MQINPQEPQRTNLCEWATHPFQDCYCIEVTGRTVSMIARYCMDNYRECPVYLKFIHRDKKEKTTEKVAYLREESENVQI